MVNAFTSSFSSSAQQHPVRSPRSNHQPTSIGRGWHGPKTIHRVLLTIVVHVKEADGGPETSFCGLGTFVSFPGATAPGQSLLNHHRRYPQQPLHFRPPTLCYHLSWVWLDSNPSRFFCYGAWLRLGLASSQIGTRPGPFYQGDNDLLIIYFIKK